jgi:hypothetical protein
MAGKTAQIPTKDTTGSQTFVPEYSFVDELPMPDQVGVRRGNSLSDVGSAIRGAIFYTDMIGFGGPSSEITRRGGMQPFPMGINFFVRTSNRCSNGADMWAYVNGIPQGNLLGARVKEAMDRLGLPPLRGLSMGMLEDARDALNPIPYANAIFGSGYVQCQQVDLPVGDIFGRLESSDTKKPPEKRKWTMPAFQGDDIIYKGGVPHQRRFVYSKWLTKEDYEKQLEVAMYCPDGSRKETHEGNNCLRPIIAKQPREGWKDFDPVEASLPAALLLSLAAVLWVRYVK